MGSVWFFEHHLPNVLKKVSLYETKIKKGDEVKEKRTVPLIVVLRNILKKKN